MRYDETSRTTAWKGIPLSLVLIFITGCASPGTSQATASAASSIEIIKDLPYAIPAASTSQPWFLDVYVPLVPANLPPVVIFGNMGHAKEGYGYQVLAQTLAEDGAVVFLPNLSPDGSGVDLFRSENGAGLREELEAAVCAVRFARAKAEEYGGAPAEVLALGHAGGGWVGIMTALVGDNIGAMWDTFSESRGGPPQQMECVQGEMLSGRPDIFLGYAGAYTRFYQVENEDRALYQLVNPPTYVDGSSDVVLRFTEAAPDTDPIHQRISALNEQFFESLNAAGYDVTWTMAETGHGIEAPAREVVIQKWREATAQP